MKIAKLLAVSGLLAVALFSRVHAQETNSYRTNVLINVTFNLTSYEQVYLFLSTNGFNGPYVPSAKTSKVSTEIGRAHV